MSPFPSTRVIDPRWAAHHRPVTTGAQTATCTITAGGTSGWDPVTGPTENTPGTTVYAGPCRVQALARGDQSADAAGQAVAEHPYLVAITTDADVPGGARVKVEACPDDPALVGKILTVAEVRHGSLRFDRDLLCDLDPTNQEA